MHCSEEVLGEGLAVHAQVYFKVSPDLDKQVVHYDEEAGQYEVLALPRPLNLPNINMLLPGQIAIQVHCA